MLTDNLKLAINDLNELLSITETDIEEIKKANHETVFKNAKVKNELIAKFENKKAEIDGELLELVHRNDKALEDILTDDEKALIDELKSKLEELKSLNRRYAKLVLGVSEFYNSLLEKVVPTEMNGYSKVATSNAYLQVKV